MLRAQVHQDDDTDELHDFIAVTVPLSPSTEQEKESLCRIDEEFLWLLLLAAVAECVTTCFMPGYTLYTWGLNVDGTVLNWIGPFLDGLSYGYEDYSKGSETSLVCVQFRSAFLGVLTSYSFMADHAGDLSSHSFAAGPLYICVSIGGGCGCFCLGKQVAAASCTHPVTATVSRVVGTMKNRPSLMTSLVTFVGVTTLRAALGAHGFVRDPKDPQFIGQVQVADGEELVLGMLMSCSAVLLSNYVSSVLAGFTYQLSLLSSTRVTKNLLALKFVSSFCGSLSVFSGAVSIISRLWLAGNRRSALWNFLLQLLVGLVCIPYLYKHVAT
ncbi:unnamed protein product [Peronospora farinosa]|uniref:Uncharacterized protein n=1 Tax=Peronospora farinosa TaxID=134698 RepID=A0ABN8CCZ8_9STRA|nr:unnamed protein product [Peronospora farinosa]